MALGTYNDLQIELLAYMGRSDSIIVARVPTFMLGAEQRIYNGYGDRGDPLYSKPLRCQLMETTATVAVTAGVGSLPADFLEQRALYIAGRAQPDYEPPQRFFGETQQFGNTQPVTFTVIGTSLWVAGAWTGTVNLVYYKQYPALTPGGAHALVQAYPLPWLHALLLEAHEWARTDGEASRYLAKLRAEISALNGVATEQRYGGPSQMTMRIDPIG